MMSRSASLNSNKGVWTATERQSGGEGIQGRRCVCVELRNDALCLASEHHGLSCRDALVAADRQLPRLVGPVLQVDVKASR